MGTTTYSRNGTHTLKSKVLEIAEGTQYANVFFCYRVLSIFPQILSPIYALGCCLLLLHTRRYRVARPTTFLSPLLRVDHYFTKPLTIGER
jgi:hypothetical protein